MKKKKSFTVK